VFREKNRGKNFHYFRNFSPEDYARVLKNAVCCIGNSSSFIRECSFLGTPTVIVGDRQAGREHGKNTVFANYDRADIEKKISEQISVGRYEPDYLFGTGNAGVRIADELARLNISIKKRSD